jgi:serine/threonine-protein kinase RsbW
VRGVRISVVDGRESPRGAIRVEEARTKTWKKSDHDFRRVVRLRWFHDSRSDRAARSRISAERNERGVISNFDLPFGPSVRFTTMSASPTMVDEFDVEIPSNAGEGHSVQERIIALVESVPFGERDIFGIRLAIEEAMVNAIKHGNQMDPEKKVRVSCRVTSGSVRIEIEDEGEGFDVSDIPDPTADENLERPCGRGLMLMRAFMTSITYNERGNRVVLVKDKTVEEDAGGESAA